ncbi:MAG: signal peptide peptidase SppA [Chitinophagaceae bacterium]|jgi:protease-4|nr:signal peptide peptidase SppA [Chitinophagaceae bacterium]
MRTFLKIFAACLLAITVVFVAGIVVLFGFVGSISESEIPVVKQQSVLLIDLSNQVTEKGSDEDFDPLTFSAESVPSLRSIIGAVENAASDSSVKTIYLKAGYNSLGYAASQELREALLLFKKSGKKIIANADVMSLRAYEVAHVANEIYAQPGGVFEWNGYFIELMFFKNALDKLEVKPEIFYAGQFKSATEPFRLTKMSEANKVQYRAFLDGMYNNLLFSIAKQRNLDSSKLRQLANKLEVRTPEQAKAAGLITDVWYEDQVRNRLARLCGVSDAADLNIMSVKDYIKATEATGTGDRIAVIYADGDIVGGKGEEGQIGSDTYRSLIAKVRNDKKIKAVVLRVNSPGGSAIASELIWRELTLLKKEKPLMVSMGDYAASGGYYIACMADSIFASPATLTGSIGVFSMYFNAEQMLNQKLGLTFDGISTSAYADFGNLTRPMSELEKTVAQRDVDSIYTTFKARVMAGRKLSSAQVDSIAQGRVWSGQDACSIGLADATGGLERAIKAAAKKAGLSKYAVRTYPLQQSLIEKIMDKSDPNTTQLKAVKKVLSPAQWNLLNQFGTLQKMANTPQARLTFVLQAR